MQAVTELVEEVMLEIKCPFCGKRAETEFHGGGEAHIVRPGSEVPVSDEQWQNYLFGRSNPKGLIRERWHHSHGCQRWFNAVRNTVTDQFVMTYKIDERPKLEGLD